MPRCETSKTPTASRTAACSLSTPPPAYSSGISQPPKSANLAPSATCRSCRGGSAEVLAHERATYSRGAIVQAGDGAVSICGHRPRTATGVPRDLASALSDTDPAELAVDAIVVGLHTAERRLGPAAAGRRARRASRPRSRAAWPRRSALLGATGAAGEVTKLATLGTITAPVVVAVGLGTAPVDGGVLAGDAAPGGRRRGPGAGRCGQGGAGAADCLTRRRRRPLLRALAEGALLGAYRFAGYKSEPATARRDPVGAVALHVTDAADKVGQGRGRSGPDRGRRRGRPRPATGSTPPRTTCARRTSPTGSPRPRTEAGARRSRCSTRRRSRKAGYGGILAVGQGSDAPPRLVRLELPPAKGARARSRWSARASRSTPAAYPIKPAAGHVGDEVRHGRRRRGRRRRMLAVAALKPKVAVTGVPADGREHALRVRPTGRATWSPCTAASGSRCSTPTPRAGWSSADAIVRACRGRAGLPVRDVDPHRRPGGRARQADRRRDGQRRRCASGSGRPATRSASRPGRCRCPDDVRKGMDSDVADISQVNAGMDRAGAHAAGRRSSCREFVDRRAALGAPRHRRAGVQLGRAVRLLAQGRHRRPGPHAPAT